MAYLTADDLAEYTRHYPDEGDGTFARFAGAACGIVEGFLGFNPERGERTFRADGNGRGMLSLPAYPIAGVVSLTADGKEVPADKIRFGGCYIYVIGGVFPAGVRNVEATVVSGFDPVPDDIFAAALRIAGALEAEGNGNIGISSKSFGDSGSRVFLNSDLSRYLKPLETYRLIREVC